MTKETILNLLQDFIISTIPENAKGSWREVELHVLVHPNFSQVHGFCFNEAEELQLEMKKGRSVRKHTLSLLQEFHKITAGQGQTVWNIGLFTLVPNGRLAYHLSWDQVRQDEVNAILKKSAEAEGIEYIEPVWKWD